MISHRDQVGASQLTSNGIAEYKKHRQKQFIMDQNGFLEIKLFIFAIKMLEVYSIIDRIFAIMAMTCLSNFSEKLQKSKKK